MKLHAPLYGPSLLALLVFMLAPVEVVAQDAPVSPIDGGPENPAAEGQEPLPGRDEAKTKTDPGRADLVLRRPDGEILMIQPDVRIQNILDWLEQQRGDAQIRPEYDITSVLLSGVADDEKARLTARIRIRLHDATRWILVPVGLEEATVEKMTYRGEGEISLDRASQRERRWWVRGAGEHELELSLIVPIRTTSPTRRLQLSLPVTASSRLDLQVELDRVSVTPPEDSWVETDVLENGGSRIRVVGLGSRLNLQWRPQVELNRVSTRLQTEVRSTFELTTEPATLTIAQNIRALQGSFQELAMILPTGFELMKVEEAENSQEGRLEEYRPDPDNAARILVRFEEPVEQAATLVWTLERNVPPKGGQLDIEPLKTENATIETGEIEIVALQGFRFQELERTELRRVSRLPRKGYVTTAYRYGTTNFRLVLDLLEVTPVYSVEPILLTKISPDFLQLDAFFRFQIRQGAIKSIDLDWPGWQQAGWELQPSDTLAGSTVAELDQINGDQIRMELGERQTGRVDVQLRAVRPIDESGVNSLQLPRLRSSGRVVNQLVVGYSPNTDVVVQPKEETVILPLSNDRIESLIAYFPQLQRPGRFLGYRIDSVDQQFDVAVEIQSQKVDVSTRFELDRETRVMTQFLDYDVQFEPLEELKLLLPPQLVDETSGQERVVVTDDGGNILTRNGSGLAVGNQLRIRLRLPESRLGRFTTVVRYPIELPDVIEGNRQLRIPMVQSSDAEFSRLEFQLPDDEQPRISMPGTDWKLRFSADAREVWQTSEPVPELVVELQSPQTGALQAYAIRKALIRTLFDAAGYTRSRVQFRIEGSVQRIPVFIPSGIQVDAFWWNEEQILPESEDAQNREYQLRVTGARDRSSSNLLTIDFHGDAPSRFDWTGEHNLQWPRLPSTVWVEQTAWEIVLPNEEFLFRTPPGFTPQFDWVRTGLFWQRLPHDEYSDPAEWIGTVGSPPESENWASGHAYIFSRFGPNTSLSFRSMKWWAVVLCGAGTTWILGLVLLKGPGRRSLLTLPLIASGFMVIGLWYPSPIKVLLQPSLLGMLLALAMAGIDSVVRQRETAVSGLSPVTDYAPTVTPTEAEVARSLGINTEGSTAVRHAEFSDSSQVENLA